MLVKCLRTAAAKAVEFLIWCKILKAEICGNGQMSFAGELQAYNVDELLVRISSKVITKLQLFSLSVFQNSEANKMFEVKNLLEIKSCQK